MAEPKAPQAQSDPWEQAAAEYKAQAGNGSAPANTSSGGGEDWKIWQQAPQQEQPGFLENLGHSVGLPTSTQELKQSAEDAYLHPIRSAIESDPGVGMLKGIYSGGKRILGELGEAYDAAKEGNGAGVGVHAAQAIPFIGAGLKKMTEEAPAVQPGQSWWEQEKGILSQPGEWGTAIGTAAQTAPVVLGATDLAAPGRPLLGRIPTRAHAGELFNTVAKDAANQPVSLSRATPHIQEMLKLGREGGGAVPAPVRQLAAFTDQPPIRSVPLLRAMQNDLNGAPESGPLPKILDYPAARNFQSGLASLSREDAGNMGGPMKGRLKQLNKSLYGDVHDAASAVGRGDDYARAMAENRRAMQLMNTLRNVGDWSVKQLPKAAGATAAYGLYKALKP